jgi:diguanylate cyclase (GGDEF)-like protein
MWSGTISTLLLTFIGLYRHQTSLFWLWFLATLIITIYRIGLHYHINRQWWRRISAPADQIYLANLLWSAATGLGTALCLLSGDPILQVLVIPTMVAFASLAACFSHGTPRYAMLQVMLLDLPLKLAVPFQPEPWFWVFVLQGPFFWLGLYKIIRALDDTSIQALLGEYHSQRRASLDPLTELFNREGWRREVLSIRGPGRTPLPASLLFSDLDGFKTINDTYGHMAGDELLRQIANRMSGALRSDDILARWGGDEFVILLPGTDPEASRLVAQRLIDIATSIEHAYPGIGLSIGMVHCEDWRGTDRERLESLVAQADHALYQAKQRGKGCFQEISG